MRTAVALIKRYPLSAFFVLAYALSWWVYPLIQVSPIVGFMGLFGPAFAAIIVVAAAEGSTPLNRGHAARAASTSHFGLLPRHLGISVGGTHKLINSSTDQR